MIFASRRRWGDNDRHFGPFTYARDSSYRSTAVVLRSGDGDEYPGCSLQLSGFGHTLIIALPGIVQPWREKVYPKGWSAETITRLGRDWYWNTAERGYGFLISRGGGVGEPSFLQVFLGRQTNDSSTTQDWTKFLPWTDWRHVRRSLYGLEGEHFTSFHEREGHVGVSKKERSRYFAIQREHERKMEAACPSHTFAFADFDGERLTANTRIEEREWRFGAGWFRWLSWFRKPLIIRRLEIEFSGETGERKGSWKGGTLGTNGPIMEPCERHEAAFRRYCGEHKMTFLGATAETAS